MFLIKNIKLILQGMLYNVENNQYLILERINLASVIDLKWCFFVAENWPQDARS